MSIAGAGPGPGLLLGLQLTRLSLQPAVEMIWAMKAHQHAEVYYNVSAPGLRGGEARAVPARPLCAREPVRVSPGPALRAPPPVFGQLRGMNRRDFPPARIRGAPPAHLPRARFVRPPAPSRRLHGGSVRRETESSWGATGTAVYTDPAPLPQDRCAWFPARDGSGCPTVHGLKQPALACAEVLMQQMPCRNLQHPFWVS